MNLLHCIALVILEIILTEGRKRHSRAHKQLEYSDCGDGPNKAVFINHAIADPLPIVSPGKLRVSAGVNITRALPYSMYLDLTVTKYFLGLPFLLPCINGIVGTCEYRNMCSYLEIFKGGNCPRVLQDQGLPCTCPVQPGTYKVKDVNLKIPKLEGISSLLAQGEYEITAKLMDDVTRGELGCIKIKFTMKRRKKKSGWFFK
ncbi:unnamed protein product [Owenia fusiformis]|uniref:Uncharacterized protein n=1 Tax=Owenia fusiformis TaxID=6347 RepID=A0A8J1TG83_OWEFU|nr:unnamed protein product [Owenia fusiformis]